MATSFASVAGRMSHHFSACSVVTSSRECLKKQRLVGVTEFENSVTARIKAVYSDRAAIDTILTVTASFLMRDRAFMSATIPAQVVRQLHGF
jgi:hypothetical protein